MKNVITLLFAIIMMVGFFSFLFLTIDIVDGRALKLVQSPYFGADTTPMALLTGIYLMFMALIGALLFMYSYRENTKPAIN